jgi:AcrR family transcriptional regulator
MSSDSTPARIVSAARDLLEREGAAAVSMRRVAERVGLSAMAIYRHYPNRDALLQQVAEAGFRELAAAWTADAAHGGDLPALMAGYLDFALRQPHQFDWLFAAERPAALQYPADFRARRSPTLTLLADALEQAMSRGELRRDDVWDVAMTVWAHAHGLICLFRSGRFGASADDFRAFYGASLRRLFDGLAG